MDKFDIGGFLESTMDSALADAVKKVQELEKEKKDGVFDKVKDKANTVADAIMADDKKKLGAEANKGTENLNKVMDQLGASRSGGRPSIVSRAKNSLFKFPVFVPSSISPRAAHSLSKAFDLVYASFVQTAISQNGLIKEDDYRNGTFLKSFHTPNDEPRMRQFFKIVDTNINESVQESTIVEEAIDEFEKILKEAYENTIQVSDQIVAHFVHTDESHPFLIQESARLANEPLLGLRGFMEGKDDRQRASKDDKSETNKTDTSESERKSTKVERSIITDSDLDKLAKAMNDAGDFDEKKTGKDLAEEIQSGKSIYSYDGRKILFKKEKDKDGNVNIVYYTPETNIDKSSSKTSGSSSSSSKGSSSSSVSSIASRRAPELLREQDLKKINGMKPWMISAELTVTDNSGKQKLANVTYLFGVKTDLHMYDIKDLTSELRGLIMGTEKSLQKVRWKTGEITFLKDYFLRTKELKADAAKSIQGNKRWINSLKRLAEYNKQYGSVLDKSVSQLNQNRDIPIPNATLILTAIDVIDMKEKTGIDLNSVGVARKLCRNMFLMTIVIVDSTAGTMKVFFPDSDSDWDIQSMAAIESEISKGENSSLMNELNRFINK